MGAARSESKGTEGVYYNTAVQNKQSTKKPKTRRNYTIIGNAYVQYRQFPNPQAYNCARRFDMPLDSIN